MPWIGVAVEADEESVKKLLSNLGLEVVRTLGVVELETSRGWIKFRVFEVLGGVEDSARVIAEDTGLPAFESGPHLILGEVSARLWDEGAKVVFPDGKSEVIPIFTYDGFLDVRMPTRKVRGVKATIIAGGKMYELPLGIAELLEIYALGQKVLEKIEKAASVYGLDKVISSDALEELKRRRAEVAVEVDYETGFVMIREGSRMRVVSINSYIPELIYRGEYTKLKELWDKAPENSKEIFRKIIENEIKAAKSIEDENRIKSLKEATEKLGITIHENDNE